MAETEAYERRELKTRILRRAQFASAQADGGVRLQERDAGAQARQDRAQYGHRRGVDDSQEDPDRGRRSAPIAGQKPVSRKPRKSIASFKLREAMAIGAKVTLRKARMYEFLDRLITIALPRVRDFRGLNPKSFDGRGNYSPSA